MSSSLSRNMARMTGRALGEFRKCYRSGKCYGNLPVSDGSTEGARWSLILNNPFSMTGGNLVTLIKMPAGPQA